MFHEILKFGSYIVDALVHYQQPVMIYIPPLGELRGGAWVVVDPSINSDMMEMYADPSSRGGVLEPSGTIEIKYRKADLIKTMRRLDPTLREQSSQLASIQKQLSATAHSPANTPPGSPHSRMKDVAPIALHSLQQAVKKIQADIDARIAHLLPIYTQVCI